MTRSRRSAKAGVRRPVASAPWIEAVAAILRGVPALPRAACAGEHDVFDAARDGDPAAVETALAICQSCPALAACQRWSNRTYPRRRPTGVLAGSYTPPVKRKKVTA